jgi:hypothetical protein
MIPALAVCGAGLGLVIAPLITIILASINPGYAGSASGVVTTVQQIGGALGVAVIGIIFFGQVSSYAPVVAQNAAQTIESRVIAAGVSPLDASRLASTFTRCFVARSQSSDPAVTPPGCPVQATTAPTGEPGCGVTPGGSASPQQTACIAYPIVQQAVATNFEHAFEDSIYFELAAFGSAFVMVIALPRRRQVSLSAASGGH